tara:strand:+ start:1038 stop:2141 length:1104 start_codon:yes stop_codon:yes gene_type:complete
MTKILLSTGGTGGHIFPILGLYTKLKKLKEIEDIKIMTDERAKNFLNIDDIVIIRSDSPFRKAGIIHIIKTFYYIFISVFKCIFFLISYRPKIIVGSGGYVSVPVLLAALILRQNFILYETNSVLGRVNRLFLPFCEKLLSGYLEIKKLPKKYKNKFFHVGQLVRNDFMEISKINTSIKQKNKILNILILGGSQGAKVFGEKLPRCFKRLDPSKIRLSIKQQVQKQQILEINNYYKNNIQYETLLFEFEKNIHDFIIESDVVICRSGSSTIAELSILNKPFIAIPLPSSLDNHQYFNAKHYYDKNCCWLLDENSKDFENEMIEILKDIYNSDVLLINKQNNLIKLNKQNSIENFVKLILNKNGLTDK